MRLPEMKDKLQRLEAEYDSAERYGDIVEMERLGYYIHELEKIIQLEEEDQALDRFLQKASSDPQVQQELASRILRFIR